jgi:CRP-like cAMP-binding protein
VSRVSIKSYRTGEVIFKQGDIMDSVYIVTKGSVRLDVNASSDAFSFIRGTLQQRRLPHQRTCCMV